MLSRHAEDLFWTGRYIERAEDTAAPLPTGEELAAELERYLRERDEPA